MIKLKNLYDFQDKKTGQCNEMITKGYLNRPLSVFLIK